jgi:hypothetical protein
MPPEFRALWTALPRAVDGTDLIVDAFVSPRLGVGASPGSAFTLADFPKFADWPSQVANHLTFEVDLGGGAAVAATRVPLTAAESDVDLDSATWTDLFPGTTPVTPWSLKSVGHRPIYSYPADQVAEYLRATYQKHGAGPDPATDEELDDLVGDAGDLLDTRPDVERADPSGATTGGEVSGGGPSGGKPGCAQGCLLAPVAWILWLLRVLWHRLVGGQNPGPAPGPSAPLSPPISETPIVVTYTTTPRPPAPVPASIAAVEAYVATNGVTPPAGWAPPGGGGAPGPSPEAIALAAAWRFYRRPESEPPKHDRPDITKVPPAPTPPEWDLHQRLGTLGDYPLLLRRLGIVIRLRVPAPAASPGTIRIVPKWDGAPDPVRDLTPKTHCVVAGASFLPQARPGSEYRDGVLDLAGAAEGPANASGFRALVVDTDGAALKLIHTAASIVRWRWMRSRLLVRDIARPEGLASLRTGGIAIARTGRAAALKQHIGALETAAPAANQHVPDELFADDVIRGVRVEVQDSAAADPTAWLSLCRRDGRYFILGDDGAIIRSFSLDDDGHVKRSGATSADDQDSPLYIHETLVRWDGWSLATPRPGRKIKAVTGTRTEPDGRVVAVQSEDVVPPVPEPDPKFHLATVFRTPPGTLPRLRIGRTYRFRIPWVDLAGESVTELPTNAPVSADITYRRFEPVAPPALLPQEPYTPGESLEVLVVRSSFDQAAAPYLAAVLEPADATQEWHATATRHVFPAKVTQELAEQHGELDGHPLDWRWQASLRADNSLDDPTLVDLDDGVTPIPFGSPGGVEIEPSQDAIDGKRERYAVNRADETLPSPYLPDPFARDVAFRRLPGAGALPAAGPLVATPLPGTPDLVCHIPFGGAWPGRLSFRIRVAERPGIVDTATGVETFVNPADPPTWDPVQRILTVFLAKAQVVEVPFSTRADTADRDRMGAVHWLRGAGLPDVEAQMELGCHWLTSPSRTLTLVHAVQRPLRPAEIVGMVDGKEIGATLAKITGFMELGIASTGQVTLLARWTDEDDPGTGPLVTTDATAVLETFTVPLDLSVAAAGARFPPDASAAPTLVARHEFGDTRHRLVSYRLKASTRFREYFPASLAGATQPDGSDGFALSGAEFVLSVRNSAPPVVPSVRYVMPSYGWDTPDPTGAAIATWPTFTRRRSGGGIRVFLDRKWRLSGPGEMLGVVLAPAAEPEDATRHTRVGVDPTTSSLYAPMMPHLDSAFFVAGTPFHNVLLEDGATTVDVVGYEPTLDENRNQWYADVTVDMSKLPDTYAPFIRLALCRFQPESVDRAHASKTVLAEFVQLAPDRELTATVTGNTVKVVVTGQGPRGAHPNLMIIALDEADDPDADELGWRPLGSVAGSADLGDDLASRLVDAVPGVSQPDGFHWEKTLTFPGNRGDTPLRLIVREVEFLVGDRDPSMGPRGGERRTEDMNVVAIALPTRLIPRIVYADAVRVG